MSRARHLGIEGFGDRGEAAERPVQGIDSPIAEPLPAGPGLDLRPCLRIALIGFVAPRSHVRGQHAGEGLVLARREDIGVERAEPRRQTGLLRKQPSVPLDCGAPSRKACGQQGPNNEAFHRRPAWTADRARLLPSPRCNRRRIAWVRKSIYGTSHGSSQKCSRRFLTSEGPPAGYKWESGSAAMRAKDGQITSPIWSAATCRRFRSDARAIAATSRKRRQERKRRQVAALHIG